MKKIASFSVNHDKLKKGMYVSRIDGDVVTYDLRMKVPNAGDYLSNGALHTFEHLFERFPAAAAKSAATTKSTTSRAPKRLPSICSRSSRTGCRRKWNTKRKSS